QAPSRPQRGELAGEQLHEAVRIAYRARAVGLAPFGVLLAQRRGPWIAARALAGDQLGERGHVAQAEIEALPRHRVNAVRGIPGEHDATGVPGLRLYQ